MRIPPRRDSCEHYLAVRVHSQQPLVARHEQTAPLAVRLVGHSIPFQNVVRAICDNVAALESDGIVEQVA